MMEIRRANEKNVEEDFSVIDVAIEVAGEEEDIDNSDFVHGLPVPPENNLGVSESVETRQKRYCLYVVNKLVSPEMV